MNEEYREDESSMCEQVSEDLDKSIKVSKRNNSGVSCHIPGVDRKKYVWMGFSFFQSVENDNRRK